MHRVYVVTGGDGFIGSHLVETILRHRDTGVKVIAIAAYQPDGYVGWLQRISASDRLSVVRGDIRDPLFLKYVLALAMEEAKTRHTPNSICWINAAAMVSVPKSAQLPFAYWDTNATSVLNVLTHLWGGIQTFIQVSTSEVFSGSDLPEAGYTQDSPLSPVSLYGASKAAAEMVIRGFRGNTPARIWAVRLFNTFGPRQFPRAVIPKMLREALKMKKDPAHRPRFGDPSAKRTFIPVAGSCSALLGAADGGLGAHSPPVVQYCGGMPPISIFDLWHTIAEIAGVDPGLVQWRCQELMRASFEVPVLKGVTSKELAHLDYNADHSALRIELDRMLSWMVRHPDYCSAVEYQ